MAALALREGAAFDPSAFAAFLAAQPDLGTKMAPAFVRIVPAMPVTATNKVHRVRLRREGFWHGGSVWRRGPGGTYAPLDDGLLTALLGEYEAHGHPAPGSR